MKQERYDAVIADIQMPGNEQLELLREMQRYAMGPPVPVILITGYPSIDTAIDAVALQVVAYLTKPFEPHIGFTSSYDTASLVTFVN